MNTENFPIEICPDSKAETDRKNEFKESACEHKKFKIHGLQKESMRLRPELEINHGGDEAQPSDHLMHQLLLASRIWRGKMSSSLPRSFERATEYNRLGDPYSR